MNSCINERLINFCKLNIIIIIESFVKNAVEMLIFLNFLQNNTSLHTQSNSFLNVYCTVYCILYVY